MNILFCKDAEKVYLVHEEGDMALYYDFRAMSNLYNTG